MLEIKNLCFSYDDQALTLNDVNFDVEAGQYISIIGHNGSGKSTLAKLIIGLLIKKSGSIKYCGEEVTEKNIIKVRDSVGIVFQNPDNQFIGSTVRDDIAFGLENHQIKRELMDSIIQEFAKKVNMEEFLDQEPSKLSGGQKQRVAIAGVLAMNPDVIIFDEATVMLDPKGKAEIREVIKNMRISNPKLTILSITHDIEEAYFSDYVLVFNEGKIILQGIPEEIFDKTEDLRNIGLDIPFIKLLKQELGKVGVTTNEEALEALVNELCQ